MKRLALIFALLATPASAWEFRAEPLCTLQHATDMARIAVTYDPSARVYAIDLTLDDGQWIADPAFHIAFLGGRSLTIGTGRHQLSEDGRTLTVRDRGFGNVLDGLEYNSGARAWSGARTILADLDGAADAVRAFRRCADSIPLV